MSPTARLEKYTDNRHEFNDGTRRHEAREDNSRRLTAFKGLSKHHEKAWRKSLSEQSHETAERREQWLGMERRSVRRSKTLQNPSFVSHFA